MTAPSKSFAKQDLPAALLAALFLGGASPVLAEKANEAEWGFSGVTCSAAAVPLVPSAYYGIDLVPTRRVPGTGGATGVGRVSFARSPFGVAISKKGSYIYDVSLSVERIKPPRKGAYTAWVTSAELDVVTRLGVLNENLQVSGRVDWNKFLLVVTLEETNDETATMWSGPIVMRGMSRSGMMHTLAGHGPYEQEPCLKYGFR